MRTLGERSNSALNDVINGGPPTRGERVMADISQKAIMGYLSPCLMGFDCNQSKAGENSATKAL